MDRRSRMDGNLAKETVAGEMTLLALVVSVMSAVKAQADHATAECLAEDGSYLLARLPGPSQGLTPEQVIQIQLSALKLNVSASGNRGIRKTFEFASPDSREICGNVDRFISLIYNPLYRSLLNFRDVRFDAIRKFPGIVEQRAIVMTQEGVEVPYTFTLTLQAETPWRNCWMTDSISRE